MSIKILNASQSTVENIAAIVLVILSISLLFLLSLCVRYRALRRLRKSKTLPVIETIVPDGVVDAIELVWHDRRWMVVLIFIALVTILALERFDSLIIVNTISYVDDCRRVERNVSSLVPMYGWTNAPGKSYHILSYHISQCCIPHITASSLRSS